MTVIKVLGEEIVVDDNRPRPHPFHSPSEALQTHYGLLEWVDSKQGFDMVRDILLRHKQNYARNTENDIEVEPSDPTVVEGYRSVLWDTINHNNTMYVSAHMVDQLEALIPSFENEPMWETDLPDEKGVVLFEGRGIRSVMSLTTMTEDGDTPLSYWIKGFVYRRVKDQVANVERNNVNMSIHIKAPPLDSDEEQDPRIIAFEQNDGIMVWPLYDAGEFFVAEGQWENNGRPPVLPMPFCAVPFGPRVESTTDFAGDLSQMRQLTVTLFRLIWQHILVEDVSFPRPERRRIDRVVAKYKRMPLDGEAIKIRHLRRIEGEEIAYERPDEPREGHSLTYRIIVRGHPRDQHYAKLGPARLPDGSWNPESHRKIWIAAFIKGPEHAPLVLKHALDAVVR